MYYFKPAFLYLRRITIFFAMLAMFLAKRSLVAYDSLLPAFNGPSPVTGKVSVAHVSLMHPYFDKPTYPLGRSPNNPIDLRRFEQDLQSGWSPDQRYQVLRDMVDTIIKNNADIISITGVTSQAMARNIIHSLYFAALQKTFVPVAGFDSTADCDLCNHIIYTEEPQTIIFSRYPMKGKVYLCDYVSFTESKEQWALGCFMGGRIAFGAAFFTFLSVNMAELPVIQTTQTLLKTGKVTTTIKVGQESIVHDYLTSIRELISPGKLPGDLPKTFSGEYVIYTGFWGLAANNLGDAPMFTDSVNKLYSTLAVAISPVQERLTSLNIMSNARTLQYFLENRVLLPQSDSLVDFIGFSTLHKAPLAMSEMTGISMEMSPWPWHHIVFRTFELSTEAIKFCNKTAQ